MRKIKKASFIGTTKYFYEELRDKTKKADRQSVMVELLADDELWVTNGGIRDLPLE